MDERVEQAAEILSRTLQANPLSREAWLQFIFEGDATRFPPNVSASSDGNVGIGASSLGGVLSMPGIPCIEIRCDPETLLRVVSGHLPLEEAMSSGRLTTEGGRDIAGGTTGRRAGPHSAGFESSENWGVGSPGLRIWSR